MLKRVWSVFRQVPARKAINVLSLAAISLQIMATGVPGLVALYADQQARIPHPLAATSQPAAAPAADAVPVTGGKAAAVPDDKLAAQLKADSKQAQTGKPVNRTHVQTLDAGRTANTKTYVNADGTKTLEQSMHASSYQDGGQWKDVDTTLDQDAATGTWHSRANAWQAKFGDVTATNGVQVIRGTQSVQFSPLGATTVKPVVTGTAPNQEVTYRNVWQGIDLKYALNGDQLKETIIIKSRAAATSFSFDAVGSDLVPDTQDGLGWYKLSGDLSGVVIAAPTIATQTGGVVGAQPFVTQSATGTASLLALTPLGSRSFQ